MEVLVVWEVEKFVNTEGILTLPSETQTREIKPPVPSEMITSPQNTQK